MRTERRLSDPVDRKALERAISTPPFEELVNDIVSEPILDSSEEWLHSAEYSLGSRRRRRVLLTVVPGVAAVAVLVVSLLFVVGPSGLNHVVRTRWQSGHVLAAGIRERKGTWRLADQALTGTWVQDTSGPPPGNLDCPSPSACYVMAGRYASDSASAPLSESLYMTDDLGQSWTQFSMPAGFESTSPLSCASPTTCFAGGTYEGSAVLLSTDDGGHSFLLAPLLASVGNIYELSCSASGFCGALAAATSLVANYVGSVPKDATFVATSDRGLTFTTQSIIAGDSMQMISCPAASDCVVAGYPDLRGSDLTSGVVAVTTDSGSSWQSGSLPAGFGTNYLSPEISCSDALHCSIVGSIAISVKNPPQCTEEGVPSSVSPTTSPTSPTIPSPAVQAIARSESAAYQHAVLNEEKFGLGYSCLGNSTTVNDIATTTDGGMTWTAEPLPASVPDPSFSGLSCPSATECWAAGSDTVPQKIGDVINGGSSVLLGTTDGGASWSAVSFTVPAGSPNYLGQEYLGIGSISCPSSSVCMALGIGAQSSPSIPVYSLVSSAVQNP
jgi:hypothetical protein